MARSLPAGLLVVGLLTSTFSVPAAAQSAASSARRVGDIEPARARMIRNRYHVRQMESVLVRAIEHAAELMTHRLTTVSPDVMALAGSPRAQGFRIEGYGLFFAVEVPRLSDSMNWALQVLADSHDQRTLSSLRRLAEAQTDPLVRADLERAMLSLRRQMGLGTAPESARTAGLRPPLPPGSAREPQPVSAPGQQAAAVSSASVPEAAGEGAVLQTTLLSNPSAAYEDEVKTALIDALLDYALTLPLEPGERVTVAARDAGYIAFPDAVAEMVTVTLSVAVDDLLAMRAQRMSRDDARRRVLVHEF